MAGVTGKLAPTAAVAVLAAWCCWPEADKPTPAAVGKVAKLPDLAALLKPVVAPNPTRDPFDLKKTAARKRSASAAAARPKPTAQTPVRVKKPLMASGLILSATLLRSSRRAALINDQYVAEGEPLKDKDGKVTCTVARVFTDRVLLRQGKETLELTFSNKSERRGLSPPSKDRRGNPGGSPPGRTKR